MNPLSLLVTIIAAITAPQLTQPTNEGLIGYFNGDCPEGWILYNDLTGRVPVGIGQYTGLAEDGRTEDVTYFIGQSGGEIRHTINEAEMCTHEHYMFGSVQKSESSGHCAECYASGFGSYLGGALWGGNPYFEYFIQASTVVPNTFKSGKAGLSSSHNNMPPYLALTACQKMTKDVSEDTFIAFRNQVDAFMGITESPTMEPTAHPSTPPTITTTSSNVPTSNPTYMPSASPTRNNTLYYALSSETKFVDKGSSVGWGVLGGLIGGLMSALCVSVPYNCYKKKNKNNAQDPAIELEESDNRPQQLKSTTTVTNYTSVPEDDNALMDETLQRGNQSRTNASE